MSTQRCTLALASADRCSFVASATSQSRGEAVPCSDHGATTLPAWSLRTETCRTVESCTVGCADCLTLALVHTWQCPLGSASSISCPAGTFSGSDRLVSESGCQECPLGQACPQGAAAPEPCAAGRYGATTGQVNRECTGPCLAGYYCYEGSTSNTSGVCREHHANSSPSHRVPAFGDARATILTSAHGVLLRRSRGHLQPLDRRGKRGRVRAVPGGPVVCERLGNLHHLRSWLVPRACGRLDVRAVRVDLQRLRSVRPEHHHPNAQSDPIALAPLDGHGGAVVV